jgi:nicotinamide mononucleotide transporter
VATFCAWLLSYGSSCLELIAVVIGVVSVVLSVRENVWSWPTALINVSLYTLLFYRTGLYSDMGLQVVYFVLSIYGWYEWLYGGKGGTELQVSRTPRSVWIVLSIVSLVFWAVDGFATSHLPNVSLPYMDAATATVSLAAQYMMTRKYLENWAAWIVIDGVYVGMFIYKGLYLTAGNYAIYLALAVMGHIAWKRSLATADASVVIAGSETATA